MDSTIDMLDKVVHFLKHLRDDVDLPEEDEREINEIFKGEDFAYMRCCKSCGSLLIEREEFLNVNDCSPGNTESGSSLVWCQGECQEESSSVEFYEFYCIKEVENEENNNP